VSSGPFIGPRGGKWADAQHTVPWHSSEGRDRRQTSLLGADDEGTKRKKPLQRLREGEVMAFLQSHGHRAGSHAEPGGHGESGVHTRQHSRQQVEVRHVESHHRDHTGRIQLPGGEHEALKKHEARQHAKVVEKLKAAGYHVRTDAVGRTLVGRRGGAPEHGPQRVQAARPKKKLELVVDNTQPGLFKSMVVRALCKAQGGPFIGPRGGKWANAQHTVPWKPSGGVLRVDAALVRETVDGWFSDLRAMPGQSRSSMIEYTQADGAKRRAVAQIVVEASTGDPRGVKGIHHYRTTGQGGMHKVVVHISMRKLAGKIDTAKEAVRSVLAHELTHAADVGLQKRAERRARAHFSGDSKGAERLRARDHSDGSANYFNQPHEVTAKMQQIQRELLDPGVGGALVEDAKNHADDPDNPPPMTPAQLLEWESPSWGEVKEHYTPENKKRVLRMVAKTHAALLSGELEPVKKAGPFSYMVLDALAKAAKGERRQGAKYIRRVPKPGGGYRYYYAESSAARSATEGEDVRLGDKLTRVHKVHAHGIEIEDEKGKRTVSHDEWSHMLHEHYGSRFYEWAEKRARQYAGAVLKHVPAELFNELKGETDAERMADLKTRLPDVHAKLEKAFSRAGVSPEDAHRAISHVLERKGWTGGARQTLLGSMLNRETAWTVRHYRRLSKAAENLAKADGAELVDQKHVAAAIALPRTATAMDRVVNRATAEMHHIRAVLKLQLTPGEKKEEQGALALDTKMSAEALAKVRAAHMIGQLSVMAQAFPGLASDPAMQQLRVLLGSLQSVAPRTEPTAKGAQTTVYVAGEFGSPEPMTAEYALVDAAELTASHDPVTFAQNEAHDIGNERAYHRDKAERAKVIKNAEDLKPDLVINTNPDATNGAPIVDENGVVLGGNSRTMSMQRVYRMGGAQAADLKGYLKGQARQFGFKPGDVEAMAQPILVRKVQPHDDDHKRLLVRQLNETFMQAMDPRTMAVAQAARLDDKALEALATDMGPDKTLAAFLGAKASDGFVNQLKRAGVISAQNQNAYIRKNGRLNENGRQLVENVLVGKVVGDADLLVDLPQPLVGALARAVPYMVQAEGAGAAYNIRSELKHALEAYTDIKNRPEFGIPKSKKEAAAVLESWKRLGGGLFEGHEVFKNPRSMAILNTLFTQAGPRQMAAVFRKYAEAAGHQEAGGGEGLGFYEKKTPDDVFGEAFGRAEDEEAAQEKAKAAREKHVEETKAEAKKKAKAKAEREAQKEGPRKLSDLPHVRDDPWDDGTTVVFRQSPFPKGDKPAISSKLISSAKVESVKLADLQGSQTEITEVGVEKHAKAPDATTPTSELPVVIRTADGKHIIQDGHHRLAAAVLRGDKDARVRVAVEPGAKEAPAPKVEPEAPAVDHAAKAEEHDIAAENMPGKYPGHAWTSTKEAAQDAHTAAEKAHQKAHASPTAENKAAAAAATKKAEEADAASEKEEADAAASQGGLF